MINTETIAKWVFWLGVVLFVISLPTTSPLDEPVGFFFPILLCVPYIYVMVRKGQKAPVD